MALEWSTDINFAGLFKRKKRRGKEEYPSKTYINLIIPDEREIRGMRSIVGLVVGVIALALFAKFGVYDFFARVMAKNVELAERSEYLSLLTVQLADYDEVMDTYRMYEAARMTEEAGDIAVVDVLDLTDRRLLPAATINSFALDNNVLTVELSEINLDSVGDLVASLYEEKTVVGVRVTTASSGIDNSDDEKKTVMLTVSLRSTAAAEAEEAEKAESQAGSTTTGE